MNKSCEKETPQSVRDDTVARIETGERPTSKAVVEEVERARSKAPPSPALPAPDLRRDEQINVAVTSETALLALPASVSPRDQQNNAEIAAEQVCQRAWLSNDQQPELRTEAQRGANFVLKHIKHQHHRNELAAMLENADGDELRDYLLRGCAVGDV